MVRKGTGAAMIFSGLLMLTADSAVAQNSQQTQNPNQSSDYLSFNQVWPSIQPALQASGQRLLKPGKERITATGTIAVNQGTPVPAQVIWELPQKIRIDVNLGSTIFDGKNAAQSVPQDKQAANEVESLLEDSLEGFFDNHLSGSNRFLGSGFHDKSAGPTTSFDIMEIWTHSKFHGSQKTTVKRYWIDTQTKLLARVVYRTTASKGSPYVIVLLSDWRDVQGEKIPFSVERQEAGTTTISLKLTSAAISPKANDNVFSGR